MKQLWQTDNAPAAKQRRRAEVPEHETWDLSSVFPSVAEWEKGFEALEAALPTLDRFRGHLADAPEVLLECVTVVGDIMKKGGKLITYAMHGSDADTTDQEAFARKTRLMQLFARVSGATAFLEPEIGRMDRATLDGFMQSEPKLKAYEHMFDDIQRKKAHQLSDKEETLLAKAVQIFGDAGETFSVLSDTDMPFDPIRDEEGRETEMSHARYGKFMESRDRRVRREAFMSMYKSFGQFRNTCAQTLGGQVRVHTYIKDVRGFSSGREAALFENNIPVSVYDSLLEAVNEKLPLLHRYVNLRRQLMGLDDLHSYDLYPSLVPDIDLHFTFEEARDILIEALAPLGTAYVNDLKKAFSERWIDYADNVGKRSGAYSGGSYLTHPFILMSWQGTLDNVFTLVHELGHSMHSFYTRANQPVQYGDYCIFLAEIASTMNENLLTDYLLKHAKSEAMRRAVINHYLDGFKGTVFRQTQFAEFEHLIHEADESGVPLTASFLQKTYGDLNRRYYGEGLTFDEEISLEWARIPHFYYNFYVYQYATGFSAATAFAERVLNGGDAEREAYLGFLKSGSSAYPIDILKKAGVDMTTPDPILKALDSFERYLDEFEKTM